MEGCGLNCLRTMTNGALWMELSEGSEQRRVVNGIVRSSEQWSIVDGTVLGQ